MFPMPIAEPTDARMNPRRVPKVPFGFLFGASISYPPIILFFPGRDRKNRGRGPAAVFGCEILLDDLAPDLAGAAGRVGLVGVDVHRRRKLG